MLYSKRTDNKKAFTNNIFSLFTAEVGGEKRDFADALYERFTVEDFSYSDDHKYWHVYGYFEKVVVPHKIAVYNAGRLLAENSWFLQFIGEGIDLWMDNLWLHDLSKFSANESFGYAFHDFKNKKYDLSFEKAWHHHKTHNEHHPEYWLNPGRGGELEMLPMPKIYVAEMVADWIGAGQVYGSTLEKWLPDNIHKFMWHEQTAETVCLFLNLIGFKTVVSGNKVTF